MPSSFEKVPTSREHTDTSVVAEAVRQELKQRGESVPNIVDLAEMLDPSDVEAYTTASDEKKKQEIMGRLLGNVLKKESHF